VYHFYLLWHYYFRHVVAERDKPHDELHAHGSCDDDGDYDERKYGDAHDDDEDDELPTWRHAASEGGADNAGAYDDGEGCVVRDALAVPQRQIRLHRR
jgi:hypothetical protein